MTGTFNLAGAGVGLWDVTVTNPDGRIGTKPQLFWIKYPAAPMIGSFGPPFGARGDDNEYRGNRGWFPEWCCGEPYQGTSVITAVVSQVTSETLTATITIPSNAPTGYGTLR